MFFAILTLICAIAVSAIAAYYSVVGLIAIFAAAPLPIALMGGSLEVAKLVTASWLYRNWKEAPKLLKYYFTVAVVVLMIITSLGIFGFLSRAHIEANLNVGENSIQLRVLEEKEKITKERLQFLLKRAGDDPDKISRKTADQIQQTQDELISIQKEKLPLLKEENKMMAEVGPLKYIAELIYGSDAENHFDAAVRFVIILLIFVFDPLAVLLIIAGNYSLNQARQTKPIPEEKEEFIKGLDNIKKKIDLTSLGPIPMNKEEIEQKTNLFK
jgi:hypothetical protein